MSIKSKPSINSIIVKLLQEPKYIFYIAYFILIAAMSISISTYEYTYGLETVLKLVRYVGYLLLAVKLFFLDDYDKKTMIKIFLIVALTVICSFIEKNNTILLTFLFIIGSRNVPLKNLIRFTLYIQMFFVVFIIGSDLVGIIPEWTYTTADGVLRYSLGYIYTSHVSSILFYIAIAYCYLRAEKLRLFELVIIELVNIIIFKYTNARTAFAFLLIAPLIFYFIRFYKRSLIKSKVISLLIIISMPLCALLSIVACYFYDPKNSIMLNLNQYLSHRLELGHSALLKYGINIFGENIVWIGKAGLHHMFDQYPSQYNYVDCSYIKIMFDFGIILLIIILCGYVLAAIKAVKEDEKYLCMAIIMVAIYSIIEPRLIQVGYNPFLVLIAAIFGCSGSKQSNKLKEILNRVVKKILK